MEQGHERHRTFSDRRYGAGNAGTLPAAVLVVAQARAGGHSHGCRYWYTRASIHGNKHATAYTIANRDGDACSTYGHGEAYAHMDAGSYWYTGANEYQRLSLVELLDWHMDGLSEGEVERVQMNRIEMQRAENGYIVYTNVGDYEDRQVWVFPSLDDALRFVVRCFVPDNKDTNAQG